MHIHNNFVYKTILKSFKKVTEFLFKVREKQVDKLSLVPRPQHLVEIEPGKNHVVIEFEGGIEVPIDFIKQKCAKVDLLLVAFLNFVDP